MDKFSIDKNGCIVIADNVPEYGYFVSDEDLEKIESACKITELHKIKIMVDSRIRPAHNHAHTHDHQHPRCDFVQHV